MLTTNCFSSEKQASVFLALLFAKEVLPIFEKDYPLDMRPRKAIEAAEAWLNNRTDAAYTAASAAAFAAESARCGIPRATHAAYAARAAEVAAFTVIYPDVTAVSAAFAASEAVGSNNYTHMFLKINLPDIFDFHIKEGLSFQQPDVVFQYLNDEQKEEFIFNMNLLTAKPMENQC